MNVLVKEVMMDSETVYRAVAESSSCLAVITSGGVRRCVRRRDCVVCVNYLITSSNILLLIISVSNVCNKEDFLFVLSIIVSVVMGGWWREHCQWPAGGGSIRAGRVGHCNYGVIGCIQHCRQGSSDFTGLEGQCQARKFYQIGRLKCERLPACKIGQRLL